MKKKSYAGPGSKLFEPELREITRRLKRKEPELEEIINQRGEEDNAGENARQEGRTSKEDPA